MPKTPFFSIFGLLIINGIAFGLMLLKFQDVTNVSTSLENRIRRLLLMAMVGILKTLDFMHPDLLCL